jgi:DNA-binding XRE family transcriptional regulator
MTIDESLTDEAIVAALGRRIEQHRVAARRTQSELAHAAGISKRTLERMEAGQGAELATLIRVLRALQLVAGFEALIPELPPSPMDQLKLQGRQRKRVGRARKPQAPDSAPSTVARAPTKWKWGDE